MLEVVALLREARETIADLIEYIENEVPRPDDTIKGALKTVSGIDHLLLHPYVPPPADPALWHWVEQPDRAAPPGHR